MNRALAPQHERVQEMNVMQRRSLSMKMYQKKLLSAAFFALALPLVFAGGASAVTFNPDGAVADPLTGKYELPAVACFGADDTFLATGDFTANPGSAAQLTTDVSACSSPAYLTYWLSGAGSAACPTESLDGACCMAAGFQWRSGGTRGCYSRFVNRVGAPAASLLYGTPESRACLKCHNDAYMVGPDPANPAHSVAAGAVSKYINASHRNSSRKITPGMPWKQINGVPETFGVFPDYAGRAIDWVNGKIETTAGSGVYTDWYWYWGYYFEDPSDGSDIAENTTGTTGVPWNVITSRGAGGFTACMYCHATGFSAENTLNTAKEPELSWPGIAWDGAVPYDPAINGAVNLRASFNNRSNPDNSVFVPSAPDCAALGGTITGSGATKFCRNATISQNACVKGGNSIPGTPDWSGAWVGSWSATTKCTITTSFNYTSWDEFGVLCSNCHNSVDGGHQDNGPRQNIDWVDDAPVVTALQQAVSINAVCLQCHGKAGSGNGQNAAMDSEPFANSADISGSHPNYHGSEFMNSPHARFSGTYAQVKDTTQYGSAFTTTFGGCEGCHDPHGSVRESLLDPVLMGGAVAEEGIKASCETCHAAYSDGDTITVSSANINHPTGVDTPMGDAGAPTDGCVLCHMPSGKHLFRIAADNATPKADGAYIDASWNTATAVCQQCHLAGRAAASMPFTAAQAAAGAAGIHTGGLNTNTDCLLCHVAGNLAGAPVITPGTNHHGLNSTCEECHPNGHSGPVPDKTSNTFCLTCHTNSGPYAVHHAVAGLSATCSSCHTIPGVTIPPMTTRDEVVAGCLGCHITAQGTNAAIKPRVGTPTAAQTEDNHHRGSSTLHFVTTTNDYGCKACHGDGAPTATATGLTGAAFCAECHTVTPGTDHHVGVCLTCHQADGSFTGTFGAGVTSGQPDPELNTSCLMCHDAVQGTFAAVNQGTDHHIGTCVVCHTLPGVAQLTTANASCLSCHATAQGAFGAIAMSTLNHLTGTGTPAGFAEACAKCHTQPGIAPQVPATCGQCHDATHYVAAGAPSYSNAQLALVANGIHDGAPVTYPVNFTAAASGVTVNVVANVLCGGSCPPLTYDWNWGDGTLNGTGASTSHPYASGGTKSITLTVKLTSNLKTVGAYTRSVTLANPDGVPVAAGTCTWARNSWTMSVLDSSTDDGADADAANDIPPALQIVVDWGDGSTKSIGTQGATLAHRYTRTGPFTVTQRATDAKLQTSTTTCTTDATPQYFTIGGTVQNRTGSLNLSGAFVRIKLGYTVVRSMFTSFGGTFTTGATLKPGVYTVTVTKAGYTFPVRTLTLGGDRTSQVIRALTP